MLFAPFHTKNFYSLGHSAFHVIICICFLAGVVISESVPIITLGRICLLHSSLAQSAGAAEYTNCISTEG